MRALFVALLVLSLHPTASAQTASAIDLAPRLVAEDLESPSLAEGHAILHRWRHATRLRRTGLTLVGLAGASLIAGAITAAVAVEPCDPDTFCVGGPGLAMAGVATITGPTLLIGAIVAARGGALRRRLLRDYDLTPWLSRGGAGLRLRLELPAPTDARTSKEVLLVDVEALETKSQRLRRAGWSLFTFGAVTFTGLGLAMALRSCDAYCEYGDGQQLGWALDVFLIGPFLVTGAILAARGHWLRARAQARIRTSPP